MYCKYQYITSLFRYHIVGFIQRFFKVLYALLTAPDGNCTYMSVLPSAMSLFSQWAYLAKTSPRVKLHLTVLRTCTIYIILKDNLSARALNTNKQERQHGVQKGRYPPQKNKPWYFLAYILRKNKNYGVEIF